MYFELCFKYGVYNFQKIVMLFKSLMTIFKCLLQKQEKMEENYQNAENEYKPHNIPSRMGN